MICSTICTRALRRAGILASVGDASAEDMSDAMEMLNEMIDTWAANGADVLKQADFAQGDELVFWVPPIALEASTIDVIAYQGTWDANANSPTLASATGTEGYVYKVATAGSTDLDDVTSWSLNDYAVYDGETWLKGISSTRFNSGIISMLCVKIAASYAVKLAPEIALEARNAWSTMLPYYAKPPTAGFDTAIRSIPSRRSVVNWEGT